MKTIVAMSLSVPDMFAEMRRSPSPGEGVRDKLDVGPGSGDSDVRGRE